MFKFVTMLALAASVFGFRNEELTPGVYKEKWGESRIIASHWKLMIKLDLKLIDKKLEELYIMKYNLGLFCKTSKINCEEFNLLSDNMLQKANIGRENLELLLHRKIKRGLLNVVGSAANFMFGTLSQYDKEEIEKEIKNLKVNSEADALKRQTKVLKSTLVEITNNREMINNHTNIIKEMLTNENRELNKQYSMINAIKLENSFKLFFDLISEEIYNIERSIVDLQHQILNPKIISFKEIINELKEVITFNPTNNILPINLENPDISLLINII